MNDKHDIVPLTDKNKFPKRNSRNTLLLNLKNKDLELNFYSSLDPEVMSKRQKLKYLSSPFLSSYTCLINFEEANFMNDKHDIVPLTDKN
ncbi:hypothetical protein EJK17_11145, partial [Lactobacillus xujianguonis]